MSNVVSDTFNTIVGAASNVLNNVWDATEDLVQGAWNAFTDILEGVLEILGFEIPEPVDGVLLTQTGSVSVLPVVYGDRMVGGAMVYMTTAGDKNKYLWAVYALADSGASGNVTSDIEAIDYIVINEKFQPVSGGPADGSSNGFKFHGSLSGEVLVEGSLGSHTTQPFPTLASDDAKWTNQHLMIGSACVAIRYTWDDDKDVFKSLPSVKFAIRGQKVLNVGLYDGTVGSEVYAYSQNPADCIFDYLTNEFYGKGLDKATEIDLASFKSARVYSDGTVTPYTGGPSHKRFECNSVIASNKPLMSNIKILLQSCRGSLLYVNGKFRLVIERHYNFSEYIVGGSAAAEYFDFNEHNIIGGWKFKSGDLSTRFNRVKVTYPNEEKDFKSDYAVVTSDAFRVEDNGRVLEKAITLPNTTNYYRAIDSASVFLRVSRQQITCSFLAAPVALQVIPGDIVAVTHATPGWGDASDPSVTGKLFKVVNLSILASGNISVSLREHEPSAYDLSLTNETITTPDTNLPDPSVIVNATALALNSQESKLLGLSDGTLLSRIHVTWTAAADVFVSGYEVEYRLSAVTTWLPAGTLKSLNSVELFISGVVDGTLYDVRIRSFNASSYKSEWLESLNHTVIGKTSPPDDVDPLTITYTLAGGVSTIKWDAVSNIDLREYEVRVGGSDWATSSFVALLKGTKLIVDGLTSGANVYRVKAIDTTNHYSVTSANVDVAVTIAPAPNVTIVIKASGTITVSWTMTQGTLPILKTKIELDTPLGVRTLSGYSYGTSYQLLPSWTGEAAVYVTHVDTSLIEGVSANVKTDVGAATATILAPSTPVIAAPVISGELHQYSWSNSKQTFAIAGYDIYIDLSSAKIPSAKRLLGRVDTSYFEHKISWEGTAILSVIARDIFDYVSPEGSRSSVVTGPSTPVLSQTVDNMNLVFTWPDASGDLPIDYYHLKVNDGLSTTFDAAVSLADGIKANTYSIPITTIIQRTYVIVAYDTVGNFSTSGALTVTPSPPNLLTINPFKFSGQDIALSWNDPSSDFPIIEYIVKYGSTWGTALEITRTKALSLNVNGDWAGARTFWIAPVDAAMDAMNRTAGSLANYGTPVSQVVTINAPAVISTPAQSFLEGTMLLLWSQPASDLPIVNYVVKRVVNSTKVIIKESKSITFSMIPDWVGGANFYISAVNSAGTESAELTYSAVVAAPNEPTISTPIIVGDRVEFTWEYPAGASAYNGSLPPASYDIRYTDSAQSFANATKILVTGTDSFSRKVDWPGTRTFFVAGIDSSGNLGAPATTSSTINLPVATTILPQVIDNNVLLRWSDSAGTLAISHYKIRRGDTYSGSTEIGSISSIFFTIFETVSATYTYWITAVDTAGNLGPNNSVTLAVSEPPDYVLFASASDDFSGAGVNTFLNSAGNLNLPVNDSETFAEHFTSKFWDQPSDQIAAGFPVYIQPTPTSASYERVWDLGTPISNVSVTFNITQETIAGVIAFSTTAASRWEVVIGISIDNITWIYFPTNSLKAFGDSFQYIKLTITVTTDSGDDLLSISDISYVVDVKEKSDSGRFTAASADANGTAVSFNKSFFDISSIVVTPAFGTAGGGSANGVTAIYDFLDVANPTTFYVYLYNTATGSRVSGDFTWNARGR